MVSVADAYREQLRLTLHTAAEAEDRKAKKKWTEEL